MAGADRRKAPVNTLPAISWSVESHSSCPLGALHLLFAGSVGRGQAHRQRADTGATSGMATKNQESRICFTATSSNRTCHRSLRCFQFRVADPVL